MAEARENVIVVGAGASAEFNLPTGARLKSDISNFCSWGKKGASTYGFAHERFSEIINAHVHFGNAPGTDIGQLRQRYQRAAISLSENMNSAPSIDNYMDTHRDDDALVAIGKSAIAELILAAERGSLLWYNPRDQTPRDPRFGATSQTWIGQLFGIMVAQRDFESFVDVLQSITFISFNYDRCIEQYFLNVSLSYFSNSVHKIEDDQLSRVQSALKVIYPYGSVGDLTRPTLGPTGFGRTYEYSDSSEFLKVASRIQTFTEGEISDEIRPAAQFAIERCETLMFLGFAFHPLNMKILAPSTGRFNVPMVIATGKGLSRDSQARVSGELAAVYTHGRESRVSIVDGTCTDLIHEYHRYLSGLSRQ